MPLTVAVDVPPGDREVLQSWFGLRRYEQGWRSGHGSCCWPVKDIVERVGVSKPTVIGWKKRYASEGIDGLADRPKPGRRRATRLRW
jgi:hypothetical protein